MACSKLNGIPLYRICLSSPSTLDPIPNCTDIRYIASSPGPNSNAHLNALHAALESGAAGCIIFDESIDITGSLAQWRFSMDFLLNHAIYYHQKTQLPFQMAQTRSTQTQTRASSSRINPHPLILQLFSNNLLRIHEQVHVFSIAQKWFQPKTPQDTNGWKCYYITRPAINYIVQKYSTFSGEWLIPPHVTLDQILFFPNTLTIQIPLFYEKYVHFRNAFYQLQLKLPLLFHDKPLLSPILPRRILPRAALYLSGFHPQSFTDPSDNILSFLSDLFKYTTIWPFQVVHSMADANILIETVYGSESVVHKKNWELTIQFSKEPYTYPISYYDMTIADLAVPISPLDISIPTFVFYLHKHGYYNLLLDNSAPVMDMTNAPLHACFLNIDTAPSSARACMLVDTLLEAGLLHSYGAYKNNRPAIRWPKDSPEYTRLLSQYRFILCFDSSLRPNSIADDFILPLVLRRIPIFEGNLSLPLVYFHHRCFCFFGNHATDEESVRTLFQQITALLHNPDVYLQIANTIKISRSGNFEKLHMSVLQTKIGQHMNKHIAHTCAHT